MAAGRGAYIVELAEQGIDCGRAVFFGKGGPERWSDVRRHLLGRIVKRDDWTTGGEVRIVKHTMIVWRAMDSAPRDRPIGLLSVQPQTGGGHVVTFDVVHWRGDGFVIGLNFDSQVGARGWHALV